MDIENLRRDYTQAGLDRDNLAPDPFAQFETWFQQVCSTDIFDPNAMVLATVSPTGQPTMRNVLLKYFDRNGLVFFTNYGSRKAQAIEGNPQVDLLFSWLPLERQVEVTGTASKISTSESLKYFMTRPRGSQLGAWCSQQSSVISSRKLLEMQFEKLRTKFQNQEIPLPDFWGGYRVVPTRFEFWQGRSSRLHDRFVYTLESNQAWGISRLSP